MRTASLLLTLCLAGCAATAPERTAPRTADPEEPAIRAAIEHYFQGHATGQGEHFAQVFHPDSKLFWVRDGQLQQRTSADYIAGAPGRAADDEAQRRRRIVSLDRTGDVAVVHVELDYPSALITDYMSMAKVDGRWLIVNKTYVVQPRSGAN
ncbi:MAG TPA: nuclear transport factor 2 family protein [Rubricoccaceae bacterium]|nr:nuclear transport factor 2 family protein [Rubricoccaceae bacterium]